MIATSLSWQSTLGPPRGWLKYELQPPCTMLNNAFCDVHYFYTECISFIWNTGILGAGEILSAEHSSNDSFFFLDSCWLFSFFKILILGFSRFLCMLITFLKKWDCASLSPLQCHLGKQRMPNPYHGNALNLNAPIVAQEHIISLELWHWHRMWVIVAVCIVQLHIMFLLHDVQIDAFCPPTAPYPQ